MSLVGEWGALQELLDLCCYCCCYHIPFNSPRDSLFPLAVFLSPIRSNDCFAYDWREMLLSCLLKKDTCCFLCPLPRILFGYPCLLPLAFNLSPCVPAIGLVLGVNSPSKSLPFHSPLYTPHHKNRSKSDFYLHLCKFCCTFVGLFVNT